MVLRECPFCHRPFEAELLAKEQVDSNELTKARDFPLEKNPITGQVTQGGVLMTEGPLIIGLSEEEKNTVATRPEAFVVYKLTYRCKHCGKEWSKLSTEEKPLPREYVEDQED